MVAGCRACSIGPALAPTESSHSTGAFALDGELPGDDQHHDVEQPPFNDARIGQSAVPWSRTLYCSSMMVSQRLQGVVARMRILMRPDSAARVILAERRRWPTGSDFGGSSSDDALLRPPRATLTPCGGLLGNGRVCIDEESGQPPTCSTLRGARPRRERQRAS